MNLDGIVRHLTAERDRISKAIAALQGSTAPAGIKRRGRPPKSAPAPDFAQASAPKKRRERPPMPAAQKKVLSEKMKANWAARKKQVGKGK